MTHRRWLLFWLIVILALISTIRYVGYGRWWGLARAVDVRLAITTHLLSLPAYRHYARDIVRINGVRAMIEIVPDARSDAELRTAVNRINHSVGTLDDGYYRASLVARTTLRNQLFRQPIELADYVGEATFWIRNGKIDALSFDVDGLRTAAFFHARFVSVLSSTPLDELAAKYPHAKFELLDGRACNFRRAKHIEHLFTDLAAWSEFVTKRLTHAGFVTSLGESGSYYRRGDFALTSARHLGMPQALMLGDEQSCRVCVVATTVNHFGEPVDTIQTIVALEQMGSSPTVIREVLRLNTGEFDVDTVNGLLAGHIAYEWVEELLNFVVFVIFLFALRFVLGILVQLKTLFTGVLVKSPTEGSKSNIATTT